MDEALNSEELLQVLRLFAFDNTDQLFWSFDDNDKLTIAVMCNDFFDWGTADCEEITPADISALTDAFVDARAATGQRFESGGELWCARKRGMRPQGACYKYVDESLWPLLDAAGPVREIGLRNPYSCPALPAGLGVPVKEQQK